MNKGVIAGIAAVTVVAAAAVGAILAGPSDQERLGNVQACLDQGGRPRAQLACVEEAMAGWEAPPSPSPSPSPSPVCPGVQVSDLLADTESNPAGTFYCLGADTFELAEPVIAEAGDVFQGEGWDATFITWTGDANAPAMITGQGTFEVHDLDISGALGSDACNPDCGRAFRPNQGMTLEGVRCHDNANQCIGSGGGTVTVQGSELIGNGYDPAFNAGDARSAAGVKRVRGGSLIVRDSLISEGGWNGLWCDYCSGTFLVENSTIIGNGANGLAWEVSGGWNDVDNAIIRNNSILGNNLGNNRAKAAINCNGCADLLVEGNTFGGTIGGLAVNILDTKRGPWGAISNVVIRDNALNGDRIVGCSLSGVTCTGNTV